VQARKEIWQRQYKLTSARRGAWNNCIEILEENESRPLSLYPYQQRVLESEFDEGTVPAPQERILSLRLAEAKGTLALKQELLPIERIRNFMRRLRYMLLDCPVDRLRALQWQFQACASSLLLAIGDFAIIKGISGAPHKYLGHYSIQETLRNPFYYNEDSRIALWCAISHEIGFPAEAGSQKSRSAYKIFLAHWRYKQFYRKSRHFYGAISLRRSHASNAQRIFDALHHHFMMFRAAESELIKNSSRVINDRLKQPFSSGHRARCRHKAQIIRDILYDINNVHHVIIYIYHNQFLPVFLCHLDIMPSDEIERRSAATQQYWLGFWQKERESGERMYCIERFQQENQQARKKFQKIKRISKRHSPVKCLHFEHDASKNKRQYRNDEKTRYKKPGKYRRQQN
jgi:hypothetical protein